MSDGSSVSIAWGIQIETIPLLLAIDAYQSSEPARRFFSLLLLRARSSTLVFTSSSRRRTIASLPFEIIEEILTYLHFKLRRKARRALIKTVGTCFCRRRRDEALCGHACGIDCSSWLDCCHLVDYDDNGWNYQRQTDFESLLSTSYTPKIQAMVSRFELDVVVSPRFSNRRGVAGKESELLDVIVGIIPFTFERPPPPFLGIPSPLSSSQVYDDEPEEFATMIMGGKLGLTTEERRRFRRITRTLHLADDFDWGKTACKASTTYMSPISGTGRDDSRDRNREGRDESYWLARGESTTEPTLLLVHASQGCFF